MPVEKINGTPISYETAGAGEPLVLVHGAWVDQHSWDPVVPGLAESFFVVTYDLRGHGGARSIHRMRERCTTTWPISSRSSSGSSSAR